MALCSYGILVRRILASEPCYPFCCRAQSDLLEQLPPYKPLGYFAVLISPRIAATI